LGGVNINVGRASEHAKVGEVRVTSCESLKGDDTIIFWPRAITNVEHGEERETLEVVGKVSKKEESFCTIREASPLSGEAPVRVGDSAFHGDLGWSADCGEGGVEKDRVTVDANASRLMPKWSDRSEDVGSWKGGIGLELKRNNNNGGSGVADNP